MHKVIPCMFVTWKYLKQLKCPFKKVIEQTWYIDLQIIMEYYAAIKENEEKLYEVIPRINCKFLKAIV